jgi:hypothetical protein
LLDHSGYNEWSKYLAVGLNEQDNYSGEGDRIYRLAMILDDGLEASTISPLRFNEEGKPVDVLDTPRPWFHQMIMSQIRLLARGDAIEATKRRAVGEEISTRATSTKEQGMQNDVVGDKKGGIDFNSANLDIQSHGQKVDFALPPNINEIGNVEINGLMPFIFNITPVTDLPLLLGEN